MNKKGQALVEFIIIIPIVVFMILAIIDFMMIFSNKNKLESKMNDVIVLYKKDKTSMDIIEYLNKDLKGVTYSSKSDNKYTYLEIKMNYSFVTPGMDKILGKKYEIKCERVILNEQ